jgi:hypothetical protein
MYRLETEIRSISHHLQISWTIAGPKDDSLTFTRQALDFIVSAESPVVKDCVGLVLRLTLTLTKLSEYIYTASMASAFGQDFSPLDYNGSSPSAYTASTTFEFDSPTTFLQFEARTVPLLVHLRKSPLGAGEVRGGCQGFAWRSPKREYRRAKNQNQRIVWTVCCQGGPRV